jgi:hypothetical protein
VGPRTATCIVDVDIDIDTVIDTDTDNLWLLKKNYYTCTTDPGAEIRRDDQETNEMRHAGVGKLPGLMIAAPMMSAMPAYKVSGPEPLSRVHGWDDALQMPRTDASLCLIASDTDAGAERAGP